jgi:SAM-dependent methyltransferase
MPAPTATEIEAFYSGGYHADLRSDGGAERVFGEKYARYAEWVQRFVSGGRALDVGCTTGLLVRLLHERGFSAEGIELNQENAKWGRDHYRVPIRTCALDDYPNAERAFDVIVLADVVEHTPRPLAFLRLVRRCLSSTGHALVTFPDICSLESRYWYGLSKFARRPWLWRNCHIPRHIWEFNRYTAEACFLSAGLTVVDFRRTQPRRPGSQGLLGLLSLPTRLLSLPAAAHMFGTQMEFMLRGGDEAVSREVPSAVTALTAALDAPQGPA